MSEVSALQITHRSEKVEIQLNKPKIQTSSFSCFYTKVEGLLFPNLVCSFALTLWMKRVRRFKEMKENIKGSQILLCRVAQTRCPVGKQVLQDPVRAWEMPEVTGGGMEGQSIPLLHLGLLTLAFH